jgi:hypothetical protein
VIRCGSSQHSIAIDFLSDDINELTDARELSRKFHRRISTGCANRFRFHQHLQPPVQQAAVIRIAQLDFNIGKFAASYLFDVSRHLVRHLRRRRAAAWAEGKNVNLREANFAADGDRFGKISIGLARKANDHVGRDRRPVETFLKETAAIDKSLTSPAAAHAAKHADAAALHGNM